MQRTIITHAYFFICVNCFSQQYPFVHYTPKDGLISNQIKNIYQDSKGRLFFTSVNGLSVYDGARFTNYTSKNGLENDIVNCVMEMGDDSIWIVTNTGKINCLVNGKIKTVGTKDQFVPVINNLMRDEKGMLYAATDQGLYLFEDGRFIQLPFIDTAGRNVNSHIAFLFPAGNYILVQRDYSITYDLKAPLYLYNKETKKITAEVHSISATSKGPDGRIWVSTEKNIMSVDTTELKKGKIILNELAARYEKIKNAGRFFVKFDREGNCWLGDQSRVLIKAGLDGSVINFTAGSGLSMLYLNGIFQDRENNTWIATHNAGLNKLVPTNFSFFETPFELSPPIDISFNENKNQLLLYSVKKATAVVTENEKQDYYKVKDANSIERMIVTPKGFFGVWVNIIYKMARKGSTFYPEVFHRDSTDNNIYSGSLVDRNGNLIVCGKFINAIVNGNIISKKKLNSFADHAALDAHGNIWLATRDGKIIMYQPRPDNPSDYLEQKAFFSNELPGISPRSIIIDKNNNIWVGTRSHGLHVFSLNNGNLTRLYLLNTSSGLSENFISYLTCDADNNIWACTPGGLDKISIRNGLPVIENLTKQNNIYQSVFKVVIDKNDIAWGLVSNGLIKITPVNKKPIDYSPTLMISMVKAGKDTISEITNSTLSYKQNNVSFYFAATSFLDEKQVLYSYRLQGGTEILWSEPSNNAMVSFIGLPPSDYTLNVKAYFPAGRYPEQMINYKFSIAPPWWQTWWFRTFVALSIIGLMIIIFRFYYRIKLEKQKTILEKQQAIEKERTRIATDMHDDLGAGLSRIKFLSETIGIKKQQQQSFEEDIIKIREYSHEMIDKMGEIVWALNEKNDSLSDLLSYTRAYAVEYLSQNGIKCRIDTPDKFPAGFVSGEFRRNIYLTVKEALHNVVKHAQASEVIMKININHNLHIEIKDDGTGFDKSSVRAFSNGLSNMQSRIKEMGGVFELINGNGTLIRIRVPLKG